MASCTELVHVPSRLVHGGDASVEEVSHYEARFGNSTMDHWGDPWADTANVKSPTKNELTSPLPPPQPSAPSLLNGFLDDAGWGNDEDGFGAWTASTGEDVAAEVTPDGHIADTNTAGYSGSEDGARWDVQVGEHIGGLDHSQEWPAPSLHRDQPDDGLIESPTSATTVQHDADTAPGATRPPDRLQPDDDSSARPSTSPSERSQNEVPTDSPKTSIEEERGAGKQNTVDGKASVDSIGGKARSNRSVTTDVDKEGSEDESEDSSPTASRRDEPREHTTTCLVDSAHDVDVLPTEALSEKTFSRSESSRTSAPSSSTGAKFLDPAALILLDELFPSLASAHAGDEVPDDPISSTSERKAWYRLTRKQTLREVNNGADDDNYIRVTWANSTIRTEVNQIVGRWAREDRLSGTGPGARASFYWDTPAPVDPKIPSTHTRTKTSVPVSRTTNVPARQSLPPLSAGAPAAFNWSSPLADVDPWTQSDPVSHSMPSSVVSSQSQAPNVVKHDIASTESEVLGMSQEIVGDVSIAFDETPAVATPTSTPAFNSIPPISSSWADFSSFDTPPSQSIDPNGAQDDDDDWGDMVGSPTVPVSNTFQTELQDAAVSSDNAIAIQDLAQPSMRDQPPEAMSAAHIVRLRGTISPTSAVFGTRNFVPLFAEKGPIGPGLLKPVDRSINSTLDQFEGKAAPAVVSDAFTENRTPFQAHKPFEATPKDIMPSLVALEPSIEALNNDISNSPTDTIPANSPRPTTPPSHPLPVESNIDPWADADFSFFESAPAPPPTASTLPVSPPTQACPSTSPVPITPPRRKYSSPGRPYARSPPREAVQVPPQPLTSATNSAQRRKEEEEQIIAGILGGLPDLAYMLR